MNNDFHCDLMFWANNRIRLVYYTGIKGKRSVGRLIDSRNGTYQRGREAEKTNSELYHTEIIRFS